ncbi:cytidyltransferase-related enzyme [SAR116 cluster alpha proteobacterium HIMB100]|nr:cytidyltransferase-related enzyme [SAR116 cluster alpha proteobacterium HIMB100]
MESDKLIELLSQQRDGLKVVFISGSFNVVHSGHVRLLNFGAECGDILIVGLNHDNEAGSIVPKELRLEAISAISVVDHAFVMEGTASNIIEKIKPDIVIKGKEHEQMQNPEQGIIDGYGGKLLFGSADSRFSSMELLKTEFNKAKPFSLTKVKNYLDRHNISQSRNKHTLEKFGQLKVLVVGDIIADEYVSCEALGMSQEDPTIVVSPITSETFLGGAGIVAAHAKGLGAEAHLISIHGCDKTADFVKERLNDFGVQSYLIADETRPTTLKKRYRSQSKTLLRVNTLRQHEISKNLAATFLQRIKELIHNLDLVIFSDFNYGCLPQGLVDEIIEICRKENVMMAADSQSSSQLGDIARFKNMKLVTPTEREVRLAVGDHTAGLVNLASQLQKNSNAENILMTLGSEGVFVQTTIENELKELMTDRIPALNPTPLDVAGGGDSLLVTAAMALAVEASIWEAALLGSIAAAIQVSRLGNLPLSKQDVYNEIMQ